jgi:16S rRNA (adenine1518-N6/adenine1519-N6)-dimethyltransferase
MGHRARKRFGQNFLVDETVTDRIVSVVSPAPGQVIIEIGPGHGALSRPLAQSGAELHLLEIDRDLAAELTAAFQDRDNVSVHCGDALRVNLPELVAQSSCRVVGNLPYNISTPLLFRLLQWKESIVDMHFMLQQEVVDRMSASPGSKDMGRLSVMCQLHCQVTPLFAVPPEAFSPVPRVHSALVRMVPHPRPPVDIRDLAAFERLVNQAFSMRRKTLRNSLRGLLDIEQIEAAGVDPGCRPEVLGLAEFAALSHRLEAGR